MHRNRQGEWCDCTSFDKSHLDRWKVCTRCGQHMPQGYDLPEPELLERAIELAREALAPFMDRPFPIEPSGRVSEGQAAHIEKLLAHHLRKEEIRSFRLTVDRENNFLVTKTLVIVPVCAYCGKRIQKIGEQVRTCPCLSPASAK